MPVCVGSRPATWRRPGSLQRLSSADGHRAGEIISRIRAFAKKAPPQKDWLDINETILEVIALARNEMQRNRVSLELNCQMTCRSFWEIESNCNKSS